MSVHTELLRRLRGGLIVSVQAEAGSPLDDPVLLAAMARAAQDGGAVAVRVQGVANLEAVRKRVNLPIIGIVKREYPGFEPYITPTVREVEELAGCAIIAFDATSRPRPQQTSLEQLVAAIHRAGALAMADCARSEDGRAARKAGAEILATTLCGYTKETAGIALPALDLVRELAHLAAFTICEGGVHEPASAAEALRAGADAVVVGTAITNLRWVVARFAGSLQRSWRG